VKTKPTALRAPAYLSDESRRWFLAVVRDYELSPHHLRILESAAKAWDRQQEARRILDEHGLSFTDRWGAPRMRPEARVESLARNDFLRSLRELSLDIEPPQNRPPARPGTR
jgi:hypothetical protein